MVPGMSVGTTAAIAMVMMFMMLMMIISIIGVGTAGVTMGDSLPGGRQDDDRDDGGLRGGRKTGRGHCLTPDLSPQMIN